MKAIILKQNFPTPNGKGRFMKGQRIKVSDRDYHIFVPRYAWDADEYLAAAKKAATAKKAKPTAKSAEPKKDT